MRLHFYFLVSYSFYSSADRSDLKVHLSDLTLDFFIISAALLFYVNKVCIRNQPFIERFNF